MMKGIDQKGIANIRSKFYLEVPEDEETLFSYVNVSLNVSVNAFGCNYLLVQSILFLHGCIFMMKGIDQKDIANIRSKFYLEVLEDEETSFSYVNVSVNVSVNAFGCNYLLVQSKLFLHGWIFMMKGIDQKGIANIRSKFYLEMPKDEETSFSYVNVSVNVSVNAFGFNYLLVQSTICLHECI